MRFTEVLGLISDILIGWEMEGDPEVEDVELHSDRVKKGDLFICRKGEKFDSHRVAKEVVEKGARALICEREVGRVGVPVAIVSDSRVAEALLAREFYGDPARKMLVIGVTGTNGKTTTVHMIHYILKNLGMTGGMISTVYNEILGDRDKTDNTTPGALYIFRAMDRILKGGGSYMVMEVSSHAIAMKRVHTVRFDVASLLNVTRDHLDFHGSFEEYKRTKFRIFDLLKPDGIGIINSEFLEDFKGKPFKKLFYGRDFWVERIGVSLEGTCFDLVSGSFRKRICMKAIGDFNALNGAFAVFSLHSIGFDLDEVSEALEGFKGVEGRFERIREAEKAGYRVIVDFAHSPDALEKVLENARRLIDGRGRVILVFGAGGHADKGKREIMGRVAQQLADISIVTNDDPRGENPEEIIADILKGFSESKKPLVLQDRREAIETAITLASKRDIIVIAGRGHEEFQIFSESKIVPFKDSEVVREIVSRKVGRKK